MRSPASGAKAKLDQHCPPGPGKIWKRVCDLGDEREAGLQLQLIHQNLETLPQFPRRFPVYEQYGHADIREFKFATYHVVYRIEVEDAVLILSILHTQRNIEFDLKRRRRYYL